MAVAKSLLSRSVQHGKGGAIELFSVHIAACYMLLLTLLEFGLILLSTVQFYSSIDWVNLLVMHCISYPSSELLHKTFSFNHIVLALWSTQYNVYTLSLIKSLLKFLVIRDVTVFHNSG